MNAFKRPRRIARRSLAILRADEGQDLAEYALLLVVFAFAVIGSVGPLSKAINNVFSQYLASKTVPTEFLAITKALDSLQVGNIAFNPVSRMDADEHYNVYLDLSYVKPLPDLEAELRSKVHGQAVEGHQIQISPVMKAQLTGDTFVVNPVRPEEQAVDARMNEWLWEVTPTRGGNRQLYLTISATVNFDGKPYPHPVSTFEKTIEVHVTPSRRLQDLVHDHWEWTYGLLAGAVLGLYKLWKKREQILEQYRLWKNRKKGGKTPPLPMDVSE